MGAFVSRLLIPLVIKVILWIIGISLGFSAWGEWKKGDSRYVGVVACYAFGTWLCFKIAAELI